MKKLIAVIVAASFAVLNINAADTFFGTNAKGVAVSVDATTGAAVYPAKSYQLYASTNGGTNYTITAAALQNIAVTNNVNLTTSSATATSAWSARVYLKGDTADHTLSVPASWNWTTNTAQTKLTTLSSNVYSVLDISTLGTNVFIGGRVYKP